MKKALKVIGIIVTTLVILLALTPILFQNQIKNIVSNYVNNNVNATVTFDDVSLSFLKSFPQAYVSVDNLKIVNNAPFEDETFATVKSIAFDMSVKELFKKSDEEPIIINSIAIDEALITLKLNEKGSANYDIAMKDEKASQNTSEPSSFSFDIDNYAIQNSAVTYIDESTRTAIYATRINHSGNASFSETLSELDTETEAQVSFSMDSVTYLDNNAIKLDALIDLNLDENKYTFKDNKGFINELPLEFNGFVQMLDEGQNIDISFKNPSSSFKDFLAVIPNQYAKNLDNVETFGEFKVNGLVKGLVTDTTIPRLDINISSNNASFKYPDLPKRVENITIHAAIKNTTGIADDTFVDINKLNFKIDNDQFKSSASLKNLTKNILVNAYVDGTLNLANISKAYPVNLENELSGILKGKLNTAFDMNALETNAFQRIKNNGNMSVSDFVFSSEDIVNPISISKADIQFNPQTITLQSFDATTGTSDLKATGTIENLLGFLLSDNKLQGNFTVNSNTFAVSDFMVEDETSTTNNKKTTDNESLKIPAFLDCTINANAKTVLYDNLTLKDVKGQMFIKDQQATLKNMTSSLFDGSLTIAGDVSTKSEVPVFNMNLGVKDFDISKSFKGLELFQSLAPIAKILDGKLNTTLNLKGQLDQSFSPQLNTISGNAITEILTKAISPKKDGIIEKLGSNLDFVDFEKLDLKDIKASLDFKDGMVTVKPFTVNYQDIAIAISGSHSFDKNLEYNAVFQVPTKYLGSDVNRLIGKIDDEAVNNLKIPVTARIGGSYTSPNVSTDITSAVTNLTNQLVEIQKQKLLNQGKDEITDLLGGLLGGKKEETSSKESDTTKVDSTTTKPEEKLTKEVTNILGGLLGGNKKKPKQEKDSINN